MRILITAPALADVLSPGGIYKVIREIAKNLSKRGHEVIVLQLNPLNRPKEEFYEGFKIIRISSRNFY
jgi:glycogen synthase